MRRLPTGIERLVEVGCTAAGLLLLAPLLAVLALLVLWDDGPPVLFSQKRVGRRGKLFCIWKFRTMHAGAPGSAITASGDHRVTRVGTWLRKFKLDELPQLYNVLKGDMSLIGPRPEVPEYVQLESPLWQAVLQVRPGITDLATLLHRDEEQILGASADPAEFYRESVLPAKLRLNLAYLRARSSWRDLNLIFLTLLYSFFPERFDRNHVKSILGMGATIHDAEYLHPLSHAVDR